MRCLASLLLQSAFASTPVLASHFQGGEISYAHIVGDSYSIQVKLWSVLEVPIDWPEITVYFGDGTAQIVPRDFTVDAFANECGNLRKSIYTATHDYPVPGAYRIRYTEPNRDAGIVNIPSSVNQPACIEALLVVDPLLGVNHSVVFDTAQSAFQHIWNVWVHDPGAANPDGDSLSFEAVLPLGFNCEPAVGSQPPWGTNFSWVDPATGVFHWDYPPLVGEWNLCIRATEWRNGILIGQVTRDMTICVGPWVIGLPENPEPRPMRAVIDGPYLYLFDAGTGPITMDIFASDGSLVMRRALAPNDHPIPIGELSVASYTVRAMSESGAPLHARFVKP